MLVYSAGLNHSDLGLGRRYEMRTKSRLNPLAVEQSPALSRTRLAVLLCWGSGDPERVPGTAGKFELCRPSVDWATESALPGDRG